MWQVWGWYENFALHTNYPQLFKCSHFLHRFYRDCLFWVFQVMLQIVILFRTSYSLCHSLLMLFPGWDNQLELSYTIVHANVDLPEEFDMFNLIKNLVVLFLVWRNWKQNTNNNQNQEEKKKGKNKGKNPGYSMTTALKFGGWDPECSWRHIHIALGYMSSSWKSQCILQFFSLWKKIIEKKIHEYMQEWL